jgi:hypothetical protein
VVPIGLSLHAERFDGQEFPVDAEQAPDDPLGFVVATFAEVVVADVPVRVDEIEGGPVVVGERVPDSVVVVGGNRVLDRSLLGRLPHAVDLTLERELRSVDSDDVQPVVVIGLRPGADVRLLAQPVDARQRPEVHDDATAELGGAEWLGVEPPSRRPERGHVHMGDHGTAASRFGWSLAPGNPPVTTLASGAVPK